MSAPIPHQEIEVISGRALLETKYPPVEFVVEGIVPQGLSLLVSKSKIGKSWLALGMAVGVANGGKALGSRDCARGEVLYADLENPPPRTQRRLKRTLADEPCPPGIFFTNSWPAMDRGALESLGHWLDAHPAAKLVIVDTVAKVWPAKMGGPGINAYYAEYQLLSAFKDLADRRGIALVLIHHKSKSAQDDQLDQVSGTAAFVGVPDAVLVLDRQRGQAESKLYVTGREVHEQELRVTFDPILGNWRILGAAGDDADANAWWDR